MTKVINPSAHCYHCKTDTVIVTLSDWDEIKGDSRYRCIRYNEKICSLCSKGNRRSEYMKHDNKIENGRIQLIDNGSFEDKLVKILLRDFPIENIIVPNKNNDSSE